MQSFNPAAVLYFFWVRLFNQPLAIPHFSVKDISSISPEKLKQRGFKGEIFDLDHTLALPKVPELYHTIKEPFSHHQSVFGDHMGIMSNSAGTPDDRNYQAAQQIEKELGIKVLRHYQKKPNVKIDSVIEYFDCDPEELVVFGDRLFTDVVFGNRYGMLTIHTASLTGENDHPVVSLARRYELSLLKKWQSAGLTAPAHQLYHPDICLEKLV